MCERVKNAMLCPLADGTASAVPAVGLLRVPLKTGRKPLGFSLEEKKARKNQVERLRKKRKKEERKEGEVLAKQTKEDLAKSRTDLAQSRADNVKLAVLMDAE